MAKSSPTWAAYFTLMACRLVALDKRPGVHPVGIGETLLQDLAKLIMRVARDQVKMICGNLKLCTGLEAGIEGATYTVGQQQLVRVRQRQRDKDKRIPGEEGNKDEEAEVVWLTVDIEGQRRRQQNASRQHYIWRWRKRKRGEKGVMGLHRLQDSLCNKSSV